ncbi:MAG: zinc-ribbon domain-containing protein [Aliarcobacter sp.]|nr:zinc-ribbon domain-containing protein [Aliarcobacter sp.]
MALVKCEECGKEISSNVKVCPHCGYKRKRGIWFYIIIVFVIIVVLAILGSNNDNSKLKANSTSQEKTSSSTVKKELYLNEVETNIFQILIRNQVEAFINEGTPIFSNDENIVIPSMVSANTIQLEYEKNEINADNLFKNKLLLVSGKVRNISKNSSNEPILLLFGGSNPYMTPRARMKKDYIDLAVDLSKGTEIKMICEVNNFIMGSVNLHNCIPFYSWFQEQDWGKITLDAYKNNTSKRADEMIEFVKTVATKVDVNSTSCAGATFDGEECVSEIGSIRDLIEEEKRGIPTTTNK